MPIVPVTISINNHKIVVDPPAATAGRGDKVEWTCDYPFAIQFKTRCPSDRVTHKHFKRQKGTATADIPGDTTRGVYHYMVAVAETLKNGDIEVHLHGSPDIIIE